MKKTLAAAVAAVAAVALLGVLAGCGPRGDRDGGASTADDKGATTQADQGSTQGSEQPPTQPDTGGLEAELDAVDNLLKGADAELAAADLAPEDAD